MKKYLTKAIYTAGAFAVSVLLFSAVSQLVPVQTVSAQQAESRAINDCKEIPLNTANCPFLKDYVVPAINALSGAVGIVVVIMVAWGGLQYTSSRDNPQQAAQAKDHIRNALMALVVYIFMIAFLNWVVPGGVF